MGQRFCNRDVTIFTAMVTAMVLVVAVNTLFKAASSKGMSTFVFLVYSYAIGALLLLPFTFFSHRSRSLPRLSFSILCKMGLLGLLACTYVVLCYTGIKYSSPTLASAIGNINPALTFVLAVVFGMEKVCMNKKTSIAKVLGTIVSIGGALVATLYHGPPLFVPSQPPVSLRRYPPSQSDWIIGGCLLTLETIVTAISHIFQAHVMSQYPCEFTVTLCHNVCISIVCAMVSIVTEKNNPDAWIIRWDLTLVSIFAAAIVNSTLYVIISWTVSHKGPVFLAMFKPFSIVIAVTIGIIFLGDSLHLGSLIGGMLISIGFYTMRWGKAKEEKEDAGKSSLHTPSSETVPLLINSDIEQESRWNQTKP